jgi:hypothetical protein
MTFESLANETLLHLFEFLSTTDLIHAFHGLKTRLNSLLLDHFAVYGIDFRSMYSDDFVAICREYLPTLIDKVPSLYLPEKNGPSQRLNELDAHGFKLGQFVQLKSLSLSYLSYKQLINKIVLALPHLINLTHLTLEHCYLTKGECGFLSAGHPIINCIWRLPKLTHCYFHNTYARQMGFTSFAEPTVTSSSITCLSISSITDHFFNLNKICERTPNLQHFAISFLWHFPNEFINSPILSITSLELSISGCQCDLAEILQFLPNLYQLKVYRDHYISGNEWQRIISNNLPKLKRFHFRMRDSLTRDESAEEYIDKLLNTFRTPFWLEERDWYVQCDWNPNENRVILYTLPYAFEYFCISDQTVGKLNYCQGKNQQSYDAVRHLGFYVEPAKCSQLFDSQFYKIKSLEIRFPVSDYFWSIVPTFDHLTSCTIIPGPSTEECKNQLQLLLSRASSLLFLGFSKNHKAGSIESLPLETKNTMIKCFSLQGSYGSYDEKQCMSFSHSPLAMQCEELHISVENRISICYLVKTMHNLRLLYVKCDDDKQKEYATEDNFIDWLRNQLTDRQPLVEISRWNSIILLKTS